MSPVPLPAAPLSGPEGAFVPAFGWILPFAGMLLSIAILPLAAPGWWHLNRNRFLVALACGLPVLALFAWHGQWETIGHTLHEYASFLILLWVLYTISGGIVLRGDLPATPRVNAAFLAVGSILASFMGTTGAAMVLVRPLIKTNSERRYRVHTVVFFIFLVCNVGGCLTPLGDPPLFLGYLRGVPFAWTFGLVKEWAFTVGALLLIYLLLDRWFYRREDLPHRVADATQIQPLRLAGRWNFLWLAGVIAAVAFLTESNLDAWLGESLVVPYLRDLVMVALGLGALATTPPRLRAENEFTWGPIVEVATLFFGIFLSMMAAIQLLHVYGPDLPLRSPRDFFWATGALSSFLDNAPTYVVFFETAKTLPTPEGMATVAGVSHHLLAGVSLGAVFLGAMTYIGNAPNFMVKAIAEERQVPMPSFFGYMLYSCSLLLPIFWVATLLFLD